MSLHDDTAPRLIKRTVAMKMLGKVSADTMRSLEARGVLTPIRLGAHPTKGHCFYRESEVADLLAHGAPAEPPPTQRLKLAERRK